MMNAGVGAQGYRGGALQPICTRDEAEATKSGKMRLFGIGGALVYRKEKSGRVKCRWPLDLKRVSH